MTTSTTETPSSTEGPDVPSQNSSSLLIKITIPVGIVVFILISGSIVTCCYIKNNQRIPQVEERPTYFENPMYRQEIPSDGTWYEPQFVSQSA